MSSSGARVRLANRGIGDDELLHHLLEAAEVLDVMNFHHGLQHLDVKPGNMLISNRHVKLADFGLVSSVVERSAEESRPLACVVTPRYASPELLQGSVSRYCDQFSLAIVYQELLTGTVPYDGAGLLKRLLKPPELHALPEVDRPVVLARRCALATRRTVTRHALSSSRQRLARLQCRLAKASLRTGHEFQQSCRAFAACSKAAGSISALVHDAYRRGEPD